ncbi:hypothetical protein ODV97_19325 [Enterococcus gallinarum]|nr:hypothetical protein [Enterococcus gallinarum]
MAGELSPATTNINGVVEYGKTQTNQHFECSLILRKLLLLKKKSKQLP